MVIACPNYRIYLLVDRPPFTVLICPQCSHHFQMSPSVDIIGSQDRTPTFAPEAFEVASRELAMSVIMTEEPGTTTAERWNFETRFSIDDIGRHLNLDARHCVLDFGCGIGRVARPLIERYGCRVVGVDTSESMRNLATDYVRSDRFEVWSPEELAEQVRRGFQADFCICLWVIQHAFDASEVIASIASALRADGLVYAMNQSERAVPTSHGWHNDGIDVIELLRRSFSEVSCHSLPLHIATARMSAITKIQVLRNPPKSCATP